MNSDDVESVVRVHLESFPGFFLSFLGQRFLRLYYLGVCNAVESIAFVYLNARGEVVGFVAGTANPRGFYSRLLRRYWLRFATASLTAIFRRPQTIVRIARAFFHPSQNPHGNDVAGLYSIAVLPRLQGNGVGKQLVVRFLEEAGRRGCAKVVLSTDRDNNDGVNSFYRNLGFAVRRHYETPEGRKMNEYWMDVKT
jgi:ribosomal protein S18 acetylase RimI-like enzyme